MLRLALKIRFQLSKLLQRSDISIIPLENISKNIVEDLRRFRKFRQVFSHEYKGLSLVYGKAAVLVSDLQPSNVSKWSNISKFYS